jgi:hypothetical protein
LFIRTSSVYSEISADFAVTLFLFRFKILSTFFLVDTRGKLRIVSDSISFQGFEAFALKTGRSRFHNVCKFTMKFTLKQPPTSSVDVETKKIFAHGISRALQYQDILFSQEFLEINNQLEFEQTVNKHEGEIFPE